MDTSRGESRRQRGTARLEALSDAVFAFSATWLVVSLEVPRTFEELTASVAGFVAFGFSFARTPSAAGGSGKPVQSF